MTERRRKSNCTTPPSERPLDLLTPSFIHLYTVVLKQYLLSIDIYFTLIYLLLLLYILLLYLQGPTVTKPFPLRINKVF